MIEFHAQLHPVATEPHTGAEVPLGYDLFGTWVEVSLGRGPTHVHYGPLAAGRLRHTPSFAAFDSPMDEATVRKLIEQTVARCMNLAKKIAFGMSPVLRHPVEVWPAAGVIRRVEIGENIPRGVTHVRRAGSTAWVAVSAFL